MLALRIALRYLFSRKSHSAVNIISLISVAGVAVATTAIVVVLSVFNGFEEIARGRLSMLDPQLKVERTDSRMIAGSDSLAAALRGIDGVEAALPVLGGQALAVLGEKQVPVTLKGVPDGFDKITSIRDLVIDGEYIDTAGSDSLTAGYGPGMPRLYCAAISVGTASRLSTPTGINDFLQLYVPRRVGKINPANPLGAFSADSVIVSAIFEVDQPQYDSDLLIMPLEGVRELLEYDNDEASAIELKLTSNASEKEVKEAVAATLGDGFTVKTRMEQQTHSVRMIGVEKWITLLLLAFILVIASFNIISTLSILVIEKEDNMATLRALGAPRNLLTRIFMTEGWLICGAGGLAGILGGVALCLAQQRWEFITISGDTSYLSILAYPVKVEPADLLIVAALVATVGLLSTLVTRSYIRSRR